MLRVDPDLDVQAVVAEQQAPPRPGFVITDELAGVGEFGFGPIVQPRPAYGGRPVRIEDVLGHVRMRGALQRYYAVEERGRIRDDGPAALGIVGAGRCRCAGAVDDIRAVQGVVETSPARVGGVECKTRVADRDDELGAGDGRNFRIDILRVYLKCVAGLDQVADVFQEAAIIVRIEGFSGVGPVVVVQPRLDRIAFSQQALVIRREGLDDVFHTGPKGGAGYADSG